MNDLDVIYLTEDFIPVEPDDPRMAMVKVRQPDGRVVFGFPSGVKQNTFEGHKGRSGMQGGSLPREGSSDKRSSMLVHHGTSLQAVEKIKTQGILAKKATIGKRPPSVYFMNSFQQTKDYVQDLHLENGEGYAIVSFEIPDGVSILEDEEEGDSFRIEQSVPAKWISSIAYFDHNDKRVS